MIPYLREGKQKREIIDVFGGYNANLRIKEGEWNDTEGITLDHYPLFASEKAKSGGFGTSINEQTVKNGLLYFFVPTRGDAPGDAFTWNLVAVDRNGEFDPLHDLPIDPDAQFVFTKHSFVSFGAYIIILPELYYLNTVDHEDQGYLTAKYEYTALEVEGGYSESVLLDDKKDFLSNSVPYTKPAPAATGDFWYDEEKKVLFRFETAGPEESGRWAEYTGTVYSHFYYGNDESGEVDETGKIGKGDVVRIKAEETENNETTEHDYGYFTVEEVSYLGFTVRGVCFPPDKKITLERIPPKMDFMFECGNRLWGCRYGENNDGEFVNEIYASELGNFKNWSKYAGVSTDSYTASIGTDGPFTGACAYLGYPTFFKGNCIHKVYGAYPAQYQVQTTMCYGMGVEAGSDRSLAVCASRLYYKAKNCIVAYDGNYPYSVSAALGTEQEIYTNAMGTSCRDKYFIAVKDSAERQLFFEYDTKRGMWLKNKEYASDDKKIESLLAFEEDIIYTVEKSFPTSFYGTVGSIKQVEAWSATSGIWQITSPDKKYVSKLTLRMTLPATSTFKAEIEYDSSGEWKTIVEDLHGNGLASFNLPILPRRCDHLRLRISGEGDCKIYSITKTIEEGSDV